MDLHSGARTCPRSRALLIERIRVEGHELEMAAAAAGVSVRTTYKWLKRFSEEGAAGLNDRSSRPRRMPKATAPGRCELVQTLRRTRMSAAAIADKLRMPRSTVARILVRAGLGKLKALEEPEPVVRYEHERAGDLLHLDIKRLGKIARVGHRIHGDRTTRVRGIGWEYVHVAIDDYSRVAYVEVLPNQNGDTTAAFLRRAIAWFKQEGVKILRILTDNGSAYRAKVFDAVCKAGEIKHRWTRPYRPQTNGKAERFIQTLLREWAYVRPYPTSNRRTAALKRYVERYNRRRPHGSLDRQPPFSRLKIRDEQRV
jgi:transposase InsO family protein